MRHSVIAAVWLCGLLTLMSGARADYQVPPEKTTQVVLSNLDVNRLVCQNGKVSDVFYSEEKGVVVSTTAHDVYVKMKMKRKLETGQLIRPVLNVDLHVVCGGQVYTLIGALKPIPAQTIRLTDGMAGVRKNIELLGAMPIEKRIKTILLAAYKNDYPESFTVTRKGDAYADMDGNSIDRVREIRIEGMGLKLTEYLVNASKPMKLTEQDFMQPAFGKHIAAISIDAAKGQLAAGNTARVFVLEGVTNE